MIVLLRTCGEFLWSNQDSSLIQRVIKYSNIFSKKKKKKVNTPNSNKRLRERDCFSYVLGLLKFASSKSK